MHRICTFRGYINSQKWWYSREASHIDFVHEKRYIDVEGGGGGLAPVTFFGEDHGKFR